MTDRAVDTTHAGPCARPTSLCRLAGRGALPDAGRDLMSAYQRHDHKPGSDGVAAAKVNAIVQNGFVAGYARAIGRSHRMTRTTLHVLAAPLEGQRKTIRLDAPASRGPPPRCRGSTARQNPATHETPRCDRRLGLPVGNPPPRVIRSLVSRARRSSDGWRSIGATAGSGAARVRRSRGIDVNPFDDPWRAIEHGANKADACAALAVAHSSVIY